MIYTHPTQTPSAIFSRAKARYNEACERLLHDRSPAAQAAIAEAKHAFDAAREAMRTEAEEIIAKARRTDTSRNAGAKSAGRASV